ncbi:hypothetical protein [Streptomyces sp. NBC_01565]|uniref:hypothetical protein n=1 Tax=Streptomyces sp. NBC_01565 TaxID=2975881 RepID=UPI002258A023|nr:hypothetical protein [Streptomyces sp. NBC_01565]MCX4546612.1 hypothetical protein [Streptomyces sp. NBC_01565]
MESVKSAALAGQRSYVPPGLRLGPPQLDFPPVPNGVDYLLSVVHHLNEDTGGSPRDIKYAVLHLQAAAEVLLKARLLREHWTLVFKDPGAATRKKKDDFSFESCTTTEAVTRLRNIAHIAITDAEAKALKDLTRDRNALQHYGLTHNARAVEARAAVVLDFLVRFLDESLLPELHEEERTRIRRPMDEVRSGLTAIEAFVGERMKRLRGSELKGAESTTAQCPDCNQLALRVAPDEARCHFCARDWTARQIAYELGDGDPDNPCNDCPGCHAPTLLDSIVFVDPIGDKDLYCVTCATRYALDELGNCAACGCYWPHEGDDDGTRQTLCGMCQDQIRREEEML